MITETGLRILKMISCGRLFAQRLLIADLLYENTDSHVMEGWELSVSFLHGYLFEH